MNETGAVMSEAQYIRDLFNLAIWLLGGTAALLVAIIGAIVKGGQRKAEEREERAREIREEDQRALNTKLGLQDASLDAIKTALFDEGRNVREFMHKIDLRVSRLEWRQFGANPPPLPEPDDGDDNRVRRR